MRKLKGLGEIIPFTSVHWFMGEQGNKHFIYRLGVVDYGLVLVRFADVSITFSSH